VWGGGGWGLGMFVGVGIHDTHPQSDWRENSDDLHEGACVCVRARVCVCVCVGACVCA